MRFCSFSWLLFYILIYNERVKGGNKYFIDLLFFLGLKNIVLVIMSIMDVNGKKKKILKNCLNRIKKEYEEIRFY